MLKRMIHELAAMAAVFDAFFLFAALCGFCVPGIISTALIFTLLCKVLLKTEES